MLVLLDNGTAEYSFIASFFNTPAAVPVSVSSPQLSRSNSGLDSNGSVLLSPSQPSPINGEFEESKSNGSEAGWTPQAQLSSINSVLGMPLPLSGSAASGLSVDGKDPKEDQANLTTIWKQVFDPVLDYCQVLLWILQSAAFTDSGECRLISRRVCNLTRRSHCSR